MADSVARLLTLLSLLQSPRERPGSELADRLGVTDRTVRRDIDRLRGLGYPIEATLGTLGGYRLAAGQAMPPLLLDDEEAVAVAVGIRAAAGMAVDGLGEASARALTKLTQVLPARLRQRVSVLAAATMPVIGDDPQVDVDVLTALAGAIARMEKVRFEYRSADGTETRRLADPVGLVAHRRRWYLVAFDDDRREWRTYRVDRVSEPRPTGMRASPPELPADSPADYVAGRRSDWGTVVHQVEVTFDAPLSAVVGRLGDGPAEVRAINAKQCRMTAERDDPLPWLAERMLALGCEFEVHSPPELAEVLAELGTRATRAARSIRPV
ncbi:Predicted DNA-binding transcriptional regulator YafY, contains an HTH and WYL domains [Sinosporangium album]|uniref:Predicted DNA-binding transcriptional regulator YafY, contains an HTH and WYL domains n=1 Tax=Sinosporangium album TaxID=504805 RepID=A0A1G7U534_9ACTN|nr:YafY family protein [Sinosporangium album]SDG42524.1 Predicted DNA-binding transcriptional regulator YafY, contains an HTH and WYL domains [Sinosporangium album]